MGWDFAHYVDVHPFADAPGQTVRVLYYPVFTDRPVVQTPHIFGLTNWDRMANEQERTLGTPFGPKTYYHGPLPSNLPGMPCGTAEQWLGEISYAVWLAGGYACSCPPPDFGPPPVAVTSVSSPGNSITVSPTTGDVHEDINLAHDNHWVSVQAFSPPNGGSPAVAVVEAAVQTQPVFVVQDNTNRSVVLVDPAEGLTIVGRLSGADPVVVENSSMTPVFRITQAGAIGTAGTMPIKAVKDVVAGWPVTDAGGTPVGCLPIYSLCLAAGTWLADVFTGADGDSLQQRVPDTANLPNTVATVATGTWDIHSNQARMSASGGDWAYITWDCASADGTIEVKVPNDAAGWCTVIARMQGRSACIMAGIAAGGGLFIWERTAGGFQLLGSTAYATTGSAAVITLTLNRAHITVQCGLSTVDAYCMSGVDSRQHGIITFTDGMLFSEFKFAT
jgi:hypothetical protein